MNMTKHKSYIILTIFIFILILIPSIFLRIKFYLLARPFWNDECALALNLVNFNLINCFKSLSYGQAAPPLFLVISEMFSCLIPNVELSLRFFPLISSILSIFVFYFLAKNTLIKKSTILFALLLFCFNYQLIYYSQEFKQYSSDVLIFISILASYFYIDIQNISKKKLILWGIVFALCIWLSFPSLFAIFSILSILALKNLKEYKKIFILSIPIIISFICFYISQNNLASSKFLHEYWQTGFISSNLNNLFSILINYFRFSFNNLFLFILFFIGLILCSTKIKSEKSLILFIPILLAICLSYFSIYPFSSRISLYLVPIFILFIVQILDYINFKNKVINYILYSVILFCGCYFIIINSIFKICLMNIDYEDIVTPLAIAEKEMSANDILYIPDGSEISYKFYQHKFNFKNVIIEKHRINNFNDYAKILTALPKGHTYYYVYCHFPDKYQRLVNIYLWAKKRKNFKSYIDKSSNALIIFAQ